MEKDPVCGMQIKETQAHASRQYSGTTFFFCSEKCVEEFDKEPAKYGGGPDTSHRPYTPSATTGVREGAAGDVPANRAAVGRVGTSTPRLAALPPRPKADPT